MRRMLWHGQLLSQSWRALPGRLRPVPPVRPVLGAQRAMSRTTSQSTLTLLAGCLRPAAPTVGAPPAMHRLVSAHQRMKTCCQQRITLLSGDLRGQQPHRHSRQRSRWPGDPAMRLGAGRATGQHPLIVPGARRRLPAILRRPAQLAQQSPVEVSSDRSAKGRQQRGSGKGCGSARAAMAAERSRPAAGRPRFSGSLAVAAASRERWLGRIASRCGSGRQRICRARNWRSEK